MGSCNSKASLAKVEEDDIWVAPVQCVESVDNWNGYNFDEYYGDSLHSKSSTHNNSFRRGSSMSRSSLRSDSITRTSSTKSNISDISNNQSNNNLEYYIDNPSQSNLPRIAFVSVLSLYQIWSDLDPLILHSCVVIINGNRFDLFKCGGTANSTLTDDSEDSQSRLSQIPFTKPFLQFLKFKDTQKLVIFLQNDGNVNALSLSLSAIQENRSAINSHPLWKQLSQTISTIFDPFRKCNYSDIDWNAPRFRSNDNMRSEIAHASFKYQTMIGILSKSNPSLIVMTHFDMQTYIKRVQWLLLRYGGDYSMIGN